VKQPDRPPIPSSRTSAPVSVSPGSGAPVSAADERRALEEMAAKEYQWGFVSPIESESIPRGLSEDVIRTISSKKGEPEWLLAWRLKAYRHWLTMKEPRWAKVSYPPIDYQDIIYYSAPRSSGKGQKGDGPKSLDEVDPELLATYEKLGIPLKERAILAGVAVDAVFDSVSVATTFKDKLASLGIIFGSFSDAVREHPELVRRYLGSVVPHTDNFFAALNSAVFSDGSFCYVPKGVRCPMELSTYFRINAAETGQFERTLIVAEEGAYVSYLEGCTAPRRDVNQLHAAVVELVALDDATIKYSTVQNWYPGDKEGRGGIYNFVTKRGACRGRRSKISWTQVETGSAITWKYPSCILQGDQSVGEFYSVAVTNHHQQADTGTKMVHIGRDTKSTIVSKGISAGRGQNTYRGQVKVLPRAENARNYTQCDSLLLGDRCGAHTVPYIEVKNRTARVEHEASTSRIGEDQIFYCQQRGLSLEDAVNLIVNGFCKQVFRELPMEFAVEAQKLLGVSLEGSVG
jgi:Fe-S cluster assembly protein SufB